MRALARKGLICLCLILGLSSFGSTAKAVTIQPGDIWKIDYTLTTTDQSALGVLIDPAASVHIDYYDSVAGFLGGLNFPTETAASAYDAGGWPSLSGYMLVSLLSGGPSDITGFASLYDPVNGIFLDPNNRIGSFTYTLNPTAVPLPAALPLFASGLAGLGWSARRKKRQQAMAC